MSDAVLEEDPDELHKAVANDPEQWFIKGESLRKASQGVLESLGAAPETEADVDAVFAWVSSYEVGRMLQGMALECLLKGTWIAQGNEIARGGKFGIPGVTGHDLYGILKVVLGGDEDEFLLEEKQHLARLSYAIVQGRYPVPKAMRRGYPSAPSSTKPVRWKRISPQEDEERFRALWARVVDVFFHHRGSV